MSETPTPRTDALRKAVERFTDDQRADAYFVGLMQLERELTAALARAEKAEKLTARFIAEINGPTHMGEPVVRTSGDRDAYEGCREDLLVWKKRAQKAEAERDEALAKLARYETLRPASEHDGKHFALWWDRDEAGEWIPICMAAGSLDFVNVPCEAWTPLPDVKEAK